MDKKSVPAKAKSNPAKASSQPSQIINAAAQESVDYRFNKITNGTRVSFDGAWAHVRNSYQHAAVIIDLYTNKIIASSILFKDYRSFPGNYKNSDAGNLMEIAALKLMQDRLCDDRIISFTSDGDVKIKTVIENLKRNVSLTMTKDPGHVFLSIVRTIKTLSTKNKNIFSPLIDNFSKFVKNIVLKINDSEKRLSVYLNISEHYSGKHDENLCLHDKDAICAQYFDETNPQAKLLIDHFLKTTSKHIVDVEPSC